MNTKPDNAGHSTLARLQAFLDDASEFSFYRECEDLRGNGLCYMGVRNQFVMANGQTASIQQSSSHYVSNSNEVEMWNCPHHELLEPYGSGEDPYGYVPLEVCAAYIDAIESQQPTTQPKTITS